MLRTHYSDTAVLAAGEGSSKGATPRKMIKSAHTAPAQTKLLVSLTEHLG